MGSLGKLYERKEMTAILSAMFTGYSAQQILKYLSQHNPRMAQQISSALNAGHSLDHVMRFLAKNEKKLGKLIPDEKENRSDNLYKTAQELHPSILGGAKALGTAGALVGGSAALGRAAPQVFGRGSIPGAAGMAAGMTPNNPTQPGPNSPGVGVVGQKPNQPINPTQGMGVQTGSPTEATLSSAPIIPNQIKPQQPPINQVEQNITQPVESLQPKGISDKLWESIQGGRLTDKDPNISAFLKVANNLRKTRGLSTKEQFDNLYKVFENKREMGLEGPELARELFAEWEQMKNPEAVQKEEKSKPIEKNSVVSSPNGVGEVKEIRNGKAVIDVDGKLHKVNEDELISSPLPEKELADLYDDLIQGVEKETGEDVSRMVDWAGYDPNTGKLAFLPHDGGLYTYSNLSKDEVDQLTSVLSTRKTSGSNFIGAWSAKSKSPIGAAMSALIKKLQLERGGKGNEYEEKFETVYKAFEPAIKAAKKKKKK